MARVQAIYLMGDDRPVLTLRPAPVAVLFEEGGWAYLNDRAGALMDEYEEDEIPVARLARLATACRTLADRYSDDDAAHESVRGNSPLVASGREVKEALLDIAELADRAQALGKGLWVAL